MPTKITPQEGGKEIEVLEAGAYPARLYSIVHQGTHVGRFGPQTQAIFRFEFPTEKVVFNEEKGEQPRAISIYISVSYGQDAQFMTVLRKLGIDTTKEFDLEDAIGKTCQITVSHKENEGKTYLNATHKDISPLMKGIKVDKQINKSQFFWINAEYEWEEVQIDTNGIIEKKNQKKGCKNVSMTGFEDLTERQNEKIVQSREYVQFLEERLTKQNETSAISEPTKDDSELPF